MFRFADDIVFLTESEVKSLSGTEKLLREEFGSKINKSKTNVMKSFRIESRNFLNIKIGVISYYKFNCLGNKITKDIQNKTNIKRRLAQAKRAFIRKLAIIKYSIMNEEET